MEDLVVIGNGMAGVACLEQILNHAPKFRVTVFGDETHVNYNRILLSSVLAGERTADDIAINSLEWYQANGIGLRLGVRIVDVDSHKCLVTGDDGSVTSFDKLLIATGSRARSCLPSAVSTKRTFSRSAIWTTRRRSSGRRRRERRRW